MITIIALLGNPGKHYARTRHNLPWMLIDFLSFSGDLVWKTKFKGLFAQCQIKGKNIILLKPHTYMNKSGECVQAAMHFFKTGPDKLLVVHDDTELDFACVDFKAGGGLGGHNGLRDLAVSLGTRDFKRMRLGISRPSHGTLSSYVLGAFTSDEAVVLPRFLESAAKALEYCMLKGFDPASEKFRKARLIGWEFDMG